MRRVLTWSCSWALLLAAAGWWYVDGLWSQRDALIEQRIRETLAERYPEWTIEFESARLEAGAKILVRNLEVGLPGQRHKLLAVPEVEIELDETLFHEQMQVLVQRMSLRRPQVLLERSADLVWNVASLPALRGSTAPLPVVEIIDATALVRLAETAEFPALEVTIAPIQAHWEAGSYIDYQVVGTAGVEGRGTIAYHGVYQCGTRNWSLAGECREWPSEDDVLSLTAGLSTEARDRLQAMAAASRGDTAAGSPMSPIRAVSNPQTGDASSASSGTRFSIPALGLSTDLELDFQLNGTGFRTPPQFNIQTRLSNGVLDNPALPAPLFGLQGEILLDSEQLVVKELRAANGESQLFIDGTASRSADRPARAFTVQATNLAFGREIRDLLWGSLRQGYDRLGAAGRFNLQVAAETDGITPWRVRLDKCEVLQTSLQPDLFRYPFENVGGEIRQEGDRFVVDLRGTAQTRPVQLTGDFTPHATGYATDLRLGFDGVPIDGVFIGSLETPALQYVRRTLEELQLTGFLTGGMSLRHSGLPESRLVVGFDARLSGGACRPLRFPLLMTELSAHIVRDPEADDGPAQRQWRFEEIVARHGPSSISGGAAYVWHDDGHSLVTLDANVLGLPIDQELHDACLTASPQMQMVFDAVAPVGSLDLEGLQFAWNPGGRPALRLPRITVKGATVRLPGWNYLWEQLTGVLGWDGERLSIASLTAWHGPKTYLQIDSHDQPESAVLLIPAAGEIAWQCHLEDVRIRDLLLDAGLIESLESTALASLLESLQIERPVHLDVGIDLKGFRDRPGVVTAAWNLHAQLPDNDLSAGISFQDAVGSMHLLRGEWDGRRAVVDGYFELDRATTLGATFTKIEGPLYFEDEDLFIGTPDWPEISRDPQPDPQLNPFAGRQARAEVLAGELGFDVHARLAPTASQQTNYRVKGALRNAKLEAYAVSRGMPADRLRGAVNGELDVIGQGASDRNLRGQGWVQISPAQLYELPILNRVLSTLELSQPDRTAFNYAYGDFTVHDGLVDFSKIDLWGESLRLVGKGTVAFGAGLGQQLAIDFYRSQFRNRLPFLGQAFSAITANSIGVQVRGTVSEPVFYGQTKLGVIDDTLRGMLDTFTPGQRPTLPRPLPSLGITNPAAIRTQSR
jgi:hypothetical protein